MSFEMPPRIAELEQDARGYPVPYIVLRERDGKPQFTANDLLLVKRAIEERLCHICGQPLDEAVWFTGGAGSALLNGVVALYADGPLHHECMRFAMAVCPHLSHRMTKAVSPVLTPKLRKQGIYVQDTTTIPGVPSIFVAVQTLRFDVRWLPLPAPTAHYIVPKPFRKVEYWQGGELMPLQDGRKAAKRAARVLATQLAAKR